MSDDALITDAMDAVRSADPDTARTKLLAALEAHPNRVDVMHALAVIQVQVGEPESALGLIQQAEQITRAQPDEQEAALLSALVLTRAAACEDLCDPGGAEAAYREVLTQVPEHPGARQGLGYLLLAQGQTDAGLAELDTFIASGVGEPDFIEGCSALVGAARKALTDDIHPKNFLEAHRGSYVEFFDHYADQMAAEGWIAEAAHMRRDESGAMVPVIPDGARPYAAVRVDMVDPESGQPGRVGDQPMVVAVAGYEPLARARWLMDWPTREHPFVVFVSTQCPWNHFSVQIRFEGGDALDQADAVMGDWYRAGFDGAFGSQDRGRFHEIGDPVSLGAHSVQYHLDLGRAETRAIDDLFRRMLVLHETHPIAALVLGRGFLPD